MTRLDELKALIETKKTTMSKSAYRSWESHSEEVYEYYQLSAVAPKVTQASNLATSRQIEYIESLFRGYGTRWTAPVTMTKNEASSLIDQIKNEPSSLNLYRHDGSL